MRTLFGATKHPPGTAGGSKVRATEHDQQIELIVLGSEPICNDGGVTIVNRCTPKKRNRTVGRQAMSKLGLKALPASIGPRASRRNDRAVVLKTEGVSAQAERTGKAVAKRGFSAERQFRRGNGTVMRGISLTPAATVFRRCLRRSVNGQSARVMVPGTKPGSQVRKHSQTPLQGHCHTMETGIQNCWSDDRSAH
jgi:hypothetical protein